MYGQDIRLIEEEGEGKTNEVTEVDGEDPIDAQVRIDEKDFEALH